MHGIVAIVLQQLRVGADWAPSPAIPARSATATPLGRAEADFFDHDEASAWPDRDSRSDRVAVPHACSLARLSHNPGGSDFLLKRDNAADLRSNQSSKRSRLQDLHTTPV